jgi:cell wall-associated NlpC family hydrolase
MIVTLLVAALLLSPALTAPAAGVPMRDTAPVPSSTGTQDLEQVIEDYDRVNSLIATDQARAEGLGRAIRTYDRQAAQARARLLPVVRRLYEAGEVTPARVILDGASVATLTDQVGMAEAFAHHTRVQIAALTSARDKAAAAKKALDATLVTLSKRRDDLAARKQTILAELATVQDIQRHVPSADLNGSTPLRPVACPYQPIGGAAGIAVRVACAQIGKPYVWAAAGPSSFDCSGLVVYAWAMAGVGLRHYTGFQWVDTTPITAAQLRPGDLVFFFPPTMHHVGIYVGGGWMVVAPHTGDVVRMQKIDTLPIGGYRRP